MNHKTILITGIHGFIGRNLVAIIKEKYPSARITGVDKTFCKGKENVAVMNLLDQKGMTHLLEQVLPDYIFHLAGNIYTENFKLLYEGNVLTTKILLDFLRNRGMSCRVIIPGSAAEYGTVHADELPIDEDHLTNPVSPYGVTKVWQTTLARYYGQLGVDVVIGRMFNLMGRDMPVELSLGSFISQLKRIKAGDLPPKLVCGNLKSKRDFIDVEEACLGLIAVAERGACGEIYNICNGESISIGDILDQMIRLINIAVAIESNEKYYKLKDIEDIYGSNNKILKETGWLPRMTLRASCERMISILSDTY